MADYLITTERLRLRHLQVRDAARMFEMDSHPAVLAAFKGYPGPVDINSTLLNIQSVQKQYVENGTGRLAVVEKEDDEFIGWAGIKIETEVNDHAQFYDLGYRFLPQYWGRGYATEAARALLDYGFTYLNQQSLPIELNKICAYVESDNLGSKRVCEKAGLTLKSTLPGKRIEELWFEITAEEYFLSGTTDGID